MPGIDQRICRRGQSPDGSGDLGGTYDIPVVVAIQGNAVEAAAPADGETLVWVAANNRWEPGPAGGVGTDTGWTALTSTGAYAGIKGGLDIDTMTFLECKRVLRALIDALLAGNLPGA